LERIGCARQRFPKAEGYAMPRVIHASAVLIMPLFLAACTATAKTAATSASGTSRIEATSTAMPSRSALDAKIARHAHKAGVPVTLARAVVRLESNFKPQAANAGNFGLMQIRLATARSMGYRGGVSGLMEPETNLTYGMKYLAEAYRLAGGETCGAIMRYQSGLRSIRMNGANRTYCSKAKVIMAQAD
jgi:soluble lytic murein transglycosylase-like protein